MSKNPAAVLFFVVLAVGVGAYVIMRPQPEPVAVEAEQALAATVPPAAVADANDAEVRIALSDIDGQMRNLSEWSGKGRLVNFWATWCAPCRREIPLLKRTQEEHAGNNVQIIGIAVDFLDEVRVYAEEAQFNYPILVGQDDAMAAAEDAGVPFIGLPFTLVVAPSGELLKSHVGEILDAHIDLIVDVFAKLDTGQLDIDGARDALKDL